MPENTKDSFVLLSSWQALACNAIESIAEHAIHVEEPSYESFKQGLTASLELLKSDPSSSAVLTLAASASERIADYHRDTQKSITGLISELHDIIGMLMTTTAEVQRESQGYESTLTQINEKIRQTQTVEDIEAVKGDLTQALDSLREQASKRRQISSEAVTGLQERLRVKEQLLSGGIVRFAETPHNSAIGESALGGHGKLASVSFEISRDKPVDTSGQHSKQLVDPGTGLPNRNAFNEAILNTPTPQTGMYMAVFYFQRMEYINARYGDSTGDDVLLFCAQLLVTQVLQPTERLYRWRGPAFCALLERKGSLENARRDIRSRVGTRVQFEQGGGTLLLNVDVASEVIPAETCNLEELNQQIEKFVLLPTNRP